MKYYLKIVPVATPNAGGRWITVETNNKPPSDRRWRSTERFFADYIPITEFLVLQQTTPPSFEEKCKRKRADGPTPCLCCAEECTG